MIANLCWLVELALESAGAVIFFRRKFPTLWIWLGFRAVADCAGMILVASHHPLTYNWLDYIQRSVQYVLVAAVSAYTCTVILRDHPRVRRFYAGLLALIALYSIAHFHALWPPSAQNVLRFEIGMELALGAMVAGAMGVANGRAPKPWGLIACGLATLAVSDMLVTVARIYGWRIEAWYPDGAIASLIILVIAGWRNYEVEELRSDLEPRMPVESVGLSADDRKLLKGMRISA